MKAKTAYLASKPRYEILDGLRGVASLMVVFFHIFEVYSGGQAHQTINHGYLAVDFFFVLSGFVVGYAYDDRWDRMTVWSFFKRRLVRLHPMVVMGTVVGLCFYYIGQGEAFPLIGNVPGWKVMLAFLMGCLMIPCGPRMDIRGWGETNSLNGPNWSLTWEYLANIVYAFVLRKLPVFLLAVLVCLAGFCTLDLCLNLNVFRLLTESRDSLMYTPIGGWSLTPEQMYIGLTRLSYPFLAGLLLSRIGKRITLRGGFWWCSLILVAVFSVPCVGGGGNVLNGVYNAACIMIVFPLVVAIGAGSQITGQKGNRVCQVIGELSYPLYITHYPLIYVQTNWVLSHQDAPLFAHVVVAAGVVVMSLFIAWASLKLYDIPVREWLKKKWL